MTLSRKKVCVFIHGGVVRGKREVSYLENRKDINVWCNAIREVGLISDIDYVFMSAGSGIDVSGAEWKKMSEQIVNRYDDYDGFIVVQGIDTIKYTASALSYMLPHIGKPLVVTATHIRGWDPETGEKFVHYGEFGLKANIINAVQLCTLDISGVFIVLGDRCMKAHREIRKGAIDSVVALFQFGAKFISEHAQRNKNVLSSDFSYNENVAYVRALPALHEKIDIHADGYFVSTYDDARLPQHLEEALRTVSSNKPVVIFSPSLKKGSHDVQISQKLGEKEFYVVTHMIFESALVKFSHILGKTKKPSEVYDLMSKNIVQEFFL